MKELNLVTLQEFSLSINIADNPLNLNINDYLEVALRNNKKRRFLFVSKTLGKHLKVAPEKVDELGKTLAKAYIKKFGNNKGNDLVIGFAETATCLAHSFFEYLDSCKYYLHTTREEIKNLKKLDFLEEHSHATEQNLYVDFLDKHLAIDKFILVDDEITTAKTCINIIKKLQEKYSIKKYIIVSILNWIDEERKQEIYKEARDLGCSIDFVYLFNGTFTFKLNNENILEDKIEKCNVDISDLEINNIYLDFKKYLNNKYIYYTGIVGMDKKMQEELKSIVKEQGKKLIPKYKENNILALGIEEFMYIPMMLSKEIKGKVYYHSLTRSPIIPIESKDYPINDKYSFESFYNENINYVYNLKGNNYKECFLFMEVPKAEEKIREFLKILKYVGIKRVNIVRCYKEGDE